LSFPENPQLSTSSSEDDGRFVRYFQNLSGARLVFSASGYQSSSKFLSLNPGERVVLDVELQKAIPGMELADLAGLVTDQNGVGIPANVKLTKTDSSESVSGVCDKVGGIDLKVKAGEYRIEVSAPGYKSVVDTLSFEVGKTLVRTFTLERTP
jgi:hypothetical protein